MAILNACALLAVEWCGVGWGGVCGMCVVWCSAVWGGVVWSVGVHGIYVHTYMPVSVFDVVLLMLHLL